MLPTLALMASPALAVVPYKVPYRNLMSTAVRAPSYFTQQGVQATAETDPCAMISQAFEAANKNNTSKLPIILDLRPSVGTACLKSVPVDTDRDLALLDYLRPYIEYQSTLELLKNPPEEYLLPGVDIMGGMQAMQQKLQGNGYESQFEVMTDLRSLFVAASDNHFGYTPGLFSAFRSVREDFELVSVSSDGRELPEVFAARDIFPGGNSTYTPSPIDTIDGEDVYDFLEKDVLTVEQGHQDPDARLNAAFGSIPGFAVDIPASANLAIFEIPDNHTIVHKNGTERVVINSIITLPTTDLCGIRSGQDFQQRFEIPPRNKPPQPGQPGQPGQPDQPGQPGQPDQPPPGDQNKPRPSSSAPPPQPTVPGYPPPLAKHSFNNVASYALNDTELQDTTVISFLSFVALGVDDPLGENFDLNSFVKEFGDVVDKTAENARKEGRDKLIIDMSANGGGSLDLADFAYTVFFPGAPFDDFDRYRMSGGLELTAKFFNFPAAMDLLAGPGAPPFGPDNQLIEAPDAFFNAPPVKGQKMTAAFHRNTLVPYLIEPEVFLRGYEPNNQGGGRNNQRRSRSRIDQRRSRIDQRWSQRRGPINQRRSRNNNNNNSNNKQNNDNNNNNNNSNNKNGAARGGQQAPPWKPENMVILTDGTCASACTIFTGLMVRNFGIRTIALGGRPLNKPMQAIGGVEGSQILSNGEIKSLMTDFTQTLEEERDPDNLLRSIRGVPSIQDPPLLPFMEDGAGGGSANVRNAYSGDDPDGFPLHFKYAAANCRLFYTKEMVLDVTESWRQAASIAWGNGTCVTGSTVNEDGSIGNSTLPFDRSVRGKAAGLPVPGGQNATATPPPTSTSLSSASGFFSTSKLPVPAASATPSCPCLSGQAE